MAPKCPLKDVPGGKSTHSFPSPREVPGPPHPSIRTESPISAHDDESALNAEGTSNCEKSSSATLDMGGQWPCMGAESSVALKTGAAAKLARFWRLAYRNKLLEKHGLSRVSTYPTCARFKFGDGRLGEVRCAADIPARLAGSRWGIRRPGRPVGFPS